MEQNLKVKTNNNPLTYMLTTAKINTNVSKYSPYMLMLSRKARLPVDLAFGFSMERTSTATHKGYVDSPRNNLKADYEMAQEVYNFLRTVK